MIFVYINLGLVYKNLIKLRNGSLAKNKNLRDSTKHFIAGVLPMSVRVNKTIYINGIAIDLVDFIDRPYEFMDLLRTQFNEFTFKKKSSETHENYLKRLFALLFYRQNRTVRPRPTQPLATKTTDDVDLSFNIIRRSGCSSRVVFKRSGNQYRLKNEDLELLINAAKTKLANKLNAKDKIIGVELEFIGQSSKIGGFCDKMKRLVGESLFSKTMRYGRNDGSQWMLGYDGTVRPRMNDKKYLPDMCGYELTSPLLKLNSDCDMELLRDVCELVKSVFGGYTNRTCGTHVHMSFQVDKEDMKPVRCFLKENEFLCHFVNSYRKSEASLFDKLVPLARRENRGRFCKTANPDYMGSRYRKINMTNFTPWANHLHLEFRQLDGTLDAERIVLWARLQALFVENVMRTWDASKKNSESPEVAKITLEEVIVSDVFEIDSSEYLMKMAGMIK